MIQGSFNAAEALNDFNRTFVADPRRAGNVVNRIATQRHHVHDPLGRHAKNLLDLRSIADQIVFRRIEHQHVIIHQLKHVFVAGNDVHGPALSSGLCSKSANYIICLVAGHLEDRNAIRLERAPDIRDLLCEIPRHLATIGFVFLVLLVAECGSRHIEYCG